MPPTTDKRRRRRGNGNPHPRLPENSPLPLQRLENGGYEIDDSYPIRFNMAKWDEDYLDPSLGAQKIRLFRSNKYVRGPLAGTVKQYAAYNLNDDGALSADEHFDARQFQLQFLPDLNDPDNEVTLRIVEQFRAYACVSITRSGRTIHTLTPDDIRGAGWNGFANGSYEGEAVLNLGNGHPRDVWEPTFPIVVPPMDNFEVLIQTSAEFSIDRYVRIRVEAWGDFFKALHA